MKNNFLTWAMLRMKYLFSVARPSRLRVFAASRRDGTPSPGTGTVPELAAETAALQALSTYRMKFRSRCFAAVLLALTSLFELRSAEPEQSQAQKAAPKPSHPAKLAVDRRAEPLRIAFISYANPQQVMQDTKAVAGYLEPFVGVPIKSFVTLDYGSAVEAMRGGQADLAFVDPLAFMMAHEQIGAQPLLLEVYSSGKPTYHSSIWVRKDSGIKTVAGLKGKTIAFADQIDMSGHLLPREIFVRANLLTDKPTQDFFKQIYFSGGDEQAVRSVLNKFVDAAGVSQYAFMLLRPEERDQVTAIAHSVSSPAHLVMCRKDLDPKISERFKQALLALEFANPEDKLILGKLYGVQGFVEAKMSDFSEVAGIAARYGFVKKPQLFGPAPGR
jgi:phosphonate transport system substrate-binding protein